MNFVSTFGAAALSCLLLPAAFASAPAGSALESSSAAIAPEVREVEKAPSSELAAAPAASSSQEASSDSQSDTSNAWRPRITILLDTGMTASLVETAAEELKLVGDAADVEVLVRGLPVTRTRQVTGPTSKPRPNVLRRSLTQASEPRSILNASPSFWPLPKRV